MARVHIAEDRVRGRKATARVEAKTQRKVARATAERVVLVAKQDTLQRGATREATQTCMLLNDFFTNTSQ